MFPRGRRDWWLTATVVALLVGEGIRRRWRRGVAAVTAIAAIRRPGRRAPLRHRYDALTAEDQRRLAARATRALHEENHGNAGG